MLSLKSSECYFYSKAAGSWHLPARTLHWSLLIVYKFFENWNPWSSQKLCWQFLSSVMIKLVYSNNVSSFHYHPLFILFSPYLSILLSIIHCCELVRHLNGKSCLFFSSAVMFLFFIILGQVNWSQVLFLVSGSNFLWSSWQLA